MPGDASSPAHDGTGPPPDPQGRSVWRRRLITAVVVGWLTMQVGLPLLQLVDRGSQARPRMFGWQMFSHQLDEPAEAYSLITVDGAEPIDVRPLLHGPMRREVRHSDALAPLLCARPGVLAIEVTDAESGPHRIECP